MHTTELPELVQHAVHMLACQCIELLAGPLRVGMSPENLTMVVSSLPVSFCGHHHLVLLLASVYRAFAYLILPYNG